MPDLNDVVRHVILRIIVDSENLAGELAKSRAQLKGLEKAEDESNKRRSKSYEGVTKSVEKLNDALAENTKVSQRQSTDAEKSAKATAAAHKESTAAVKEETKAIGEQTVAEAKAAAVTEKSRQDRITAEAERRRYNQDTANKALAAEAKLAESEEKTRQARLIKDAERKRFNGETARLEQAELLNIDGLRKRLDADQKDRDDAAIERIKQMGAETQKVIEQSRDIRLGSQVRRANSTNESKARIDRQDNASAEQVKLLGAKVQKVIEESREIRLGSQIRRANSLNESNAKIASGEATTQRRDDSAKATTERQNKTAESNRLDNAKKTDAAIENSRKESEKRQAAGDERLNKLRATNSAELATVLIKQEEAVTTARQQGKDKRSISQAAASKADSQAEIASLRVQEQLGKTLSGEIDRRTTSQTLANKQIKEQVAGTSQLQILEERLAKAAATRADAEERYAANAARRAKTTGGLENERTRVGIGGFIQGALAPREQVSRNEAPAASLRRDSNLVGNALQDLKPASTVANRAFEELSVTISKLGDKFPRLRAGLRGMRDELRDTKGGGGTSAFASIATGLSELASRFTSNGGPLLRFLTSFRGLILIVITALGPLAAALGAVGAAALGLASNLGALTGVLFALPGLVTAAVAAFGALSIIMKPLSSVFSAYTAAQKAATSATADSANTAKDAANKFTAAQQALTAAQTASQRAAEDAPRAQSKLNDAYKTARRNIEDYRLALKKLEYDQTSASLGVESAEQEYRRTLADPTANNLDRKVARNSVVGSLFDQAQTTLDTSRTEEDANEALQKGVEGSDEVIQAKRDVADANTAMATTALAAKQAQLDLNEAEKDKAAGGSTARKAQEELEAQLATLGPKTGKVVEAFFGLGDAYKAVQKRLSERLFDKLSGDTGKFADVLKSLEDFLGPVADAFGILADKAITLFTNPEWKAFFETQGEKNGSILTTLGTAALSAADGFKNIIEIAQPFTDFVVGGIAKFADSFDKFTSSEDGRKKITDFLKITMTRMRDLAPIIGNIIGGFAGFFTALNTPYGDDKKDFTTRINEGLGGLATTFKKLGDKASDPNGGFIKWLQNIGPLIKDVVKFVGQVASFFGDLFSDKKNITEAQNIFKAIGEKFLPAIQEVLGAISDSGLISKIIGGISDIADAFGKFLELGGGSAISVFADALSTIGTIISNVAGLIKTAADYFPPLRIAIEGILTALAVLAGGALLGKLTGLFGALKGGRAVFEALGFGGNKAEQPKGVAARVGNARDTVVDKLFGRDSGETAASRDRANGATPRNATGGVLPTLYRMEAYLKEIVILLGGTGGTATSTKGGGTTPSGGGTGTSAEDEKSNRRNKTSTTTTETSSTSSGAAKTSRTRRLASRLNPFSRNRGAATAVAETVEGSLLGSVSASGASTIVDDRTATPGSVRSRVTNARSPGTVQANDATPISRFSPVDYGDLYDDAAVEDRRRTATTNRNSRSSSGRVTPTQRRRATARSRYDTRNRALTGRTGNGVLDEVINAFTTAKGSTYDVHDDGTTTRNKAYRPEHGVSEQGIQPRSQRTFYVSSDDASTLGEFQTESEYNRSIQTAGKEAAVRYDSGDRSGTYESRTRVPIHEEPAVGRIPVETFDDGSKAHFGNEITDVSRRARTTEAGEKQSLGRRVANRLRAQNSNDDGSIPLERSTRRASTATGGRGVRGIASRLFGGAERSAGRGVVGGVERAATRGLGRTALGGVARLGGGLARGLAGGLVGAALSGAVQIGGEYLTDKFVKDDEDAASVNRGLGAVANGAGIGATIGSIVPGVGTVIGGAIGGLAGGAYSLYKDKNLRSFVGGKISSGAKAVGGFVGGAVDNVKSIFSGKDDDGKELSGGQRVGRALSAVTGPIGALLGGTDIGKTITGSLGKAADKVGEFFTKTIPAAFQRGIVKPISTFFTKTLPSLPGKAFDAITAGFGVLFGFFVYKLPQITKQFFLKTLPHLASEAWTGIKENLFEPIGKFVTETLPNFFTKTIPKWFSSAKEWFQTQVVGGIKTFVTETVPNFFTETIPKWFEEAPKWFSEHVKEPVTNFFTVSVPEFFTKTLPDAITKLPGFLYDNLVQPILDFFSGIAGHVTDFLKGSFDWAKGLFARGSKNFEAGAASQKSSMSGGLVDGIYQGIEDNRPYLLTAEEFVVRRGAVKQPGGKMFLRDYNEGRITPAQIYAGLSAQAAPQFMSLVAPSAPVITGGVTNSTATTNQGLTVGDITIHNPVKEKSDRSMRRALQVAAIRHRL